MNPTVSYLTIDWLNEFEPITSIIDIPDDQGGRVMIRLTRSGYDFADETEHLITDYHVWLRIDDAGAREAIRSEGTSLDDGRFGGGSTLLAAQIYTQGHLITMAICALLVFQPIQAFDLAKTITWPKALTLILLFCFSLMTMFVQSFKPFLYFQF